MTCVRRQSRHGGARQARGSIILPAAVAVLVSIFLLASADVGYLFYLKRELQKSADLAAVAGAQRIEIGDVGPACSDAVREAVGDVARRNLEPAGVTAKPATVRCGLWEQRGNGLVPPAELGDPEAPAQWRLDLSADTNAVWVRLDLMAPRLMPLLPLSRNVMAHAVAMQDSPTASFSVGSRLLDLDRSPLSSVLRAIGVDVAQAGVLNYSGIAQATLTPAGLLGELGIPVDLDLSVGELNDLLAESRVGVGAVLDATLRAVGQDGLLGVNAAVLDSVTAVIPLVTDTTQIVLGSANDVRGVFAEIIGLDSDPAAPVLSAAVSALDILSAAIGVATRGHAVEIDKGLTLPGLSNLISVRSSVVEPPSVAIERLAHAGEEASALAHNAQIRLGLDVCVGGNCGGALSSILGFLGTQVKLPITLEVANGSARLHDARCVPEPAAQLRVYTSALRLCVGHIDPEQRFSTRQSCNVSLAPETLVSVLGAPLLKGSVHLNAFPSETVVVAEDGWRVTPAGNGPDNWMRVGEVWRTDSGVDTADAVSGLLSGLLQNVGGLLEGDGAVGEKPIVNTESAAAALVRYYLGKEGDGFAPLPTTRLGLLGLIGPGGAYDVPSLAARLERDHNRSQQECVLNLLNVLPLVCRTGSGWNSWADRTAGSLLGLIPTSTCVTKIGLFATASDVVAFNRCVELELARELQTPSAGGGGGSPLLNVVGPAVLNLLQPALQSVGSVVDELINDVIGLDISEADVQLLSLSCHNARLVY